MQKRFYKFGKMIGTCDIFNAHISNPNALHSLCKAAFNASQSKFRVAFWNMLHTYLFNKTAAYTLRRIEISVLFQFVLPY